MSDCVFCRIVKGASPASVVWSDERVLAFLDIEPVNVGHVLIIPKTHAAKLSELDEEVGAQMFRVAMRVSTALETSDIRPEAINLVLADGEVAGQEILHVHLHVIPRFKSDGFGFRFGARYGIRPNRKELDETAQKIRNALDEIASKKVPKT